MSLDDGYPWMSAKLSPEAVLLDLERFERNVGLQYSAGLGDGEDRKYFKIDSLSSKEVSKFIRENFTNLGPGQRVDARCTASLFPSDEKGLTINYLELLEGERVVSRAQVYWEHSKQADDCVVGAA